MLPRLIDIFYDWLSDKNFFSTCHPEQTFFKLPDCNAAVFAILSDTYYHIIAMIASKDLQNEHILLILSLTSQNFYYINDYVTIFSIIDLDLLEIHYLIL